MYICLCLTLTYDCMVAQGAQELPTYANFVVAGASGMSAWMFIHPVDLVKTRMQLLGDEKGDATAVTIAKTLVRQITP